MTYGIDNPGLGLGQAQKYGRVKPVNGFPTFPFWRCHWLVNSKGQSEMNPYVALLNVCVYRQTNEYKKDPTNISEILTTRLVESLTHHLSSWLTTWVLDSPLEFLTHHLSPWLTTCVWDLPFCTQNNKECTSGTCDLFLVGTRQHFILQGSLNLILIILEITLISFIQF